MNIFKDIKNIAILVLIAVVVVSQIKGCEKTKEVGDSIVIEKVTVKEIPVKVEVPKYIPQTVIEVHEKIVPQNVDTAVVLEKYFKKFKYTDVQNIPYGKDFPDSLKLANKPDGIGTLTITDDVTQNQLVGRTLSWDFTVPYIIKEKTIIIPPKPKTQVYYGFGTGFNQVNFIDNVYGGVIVKTKKDKIYSANLGVSSTGSNITPFIGGGIYWKIQLRKPKLSDVLKATK
jgi:hypothetical protein